MFLIKLTNKDILNIYLNYINWKGDHITRNILIFSIYFFFIFNYLYFIYFKNLKKNKKNKEMQSLNFYWLYNNKIRWIKRKRKMHSFILLYNQYMYYKI